VRAKSAAASIAAAGSRHFASRHSWRQAKNHIASSGGGWRQHRADDIGVHRVYLCAMLGASRVAAEQQQAAISRKDGDLAQRRLCA